MPWEKSFDADEVLDAAMTLFWERGYRGVSMADLVDELGVNRSSLYATYGHKEDLFGQALIRYDRVHRHEWFEDLRVRLEPLESIRQAFAEVSDTTQGSRRFGCLLVNTTLDLPPDDTTFTEIVQVAFAATEQFFERQLADAKIRGELSADTDTVALAATLMALFLGIRVLARAQRPSDAAAPILRQVDSMLQVGV